MLKLILIATLPFLGLFDQTPDGSVDLRPSSSDNGTLQKMIVADGRILMKIDLSRLDRSLRAKTSRPSELRFDAKEGAFFEILVFNNELRGPLPSSMDIIPQNSVALPSKLASSYKQLVVEYLPWSSDHEMAVRDGKTGFPFFYIDGFESAYAPETNSLTIQGGRLSIAKEFATELGRPTDAGTIVGDISIVATMRAIEITQITDGAVESDVLPPANIPDSGTVHGPDVIVGDVSGLSQVGSQVGTQVGLAIATDSCNLGVVPLNWLALPQVDHPVIPQNLYRMSGGVSNTDRFEQVGQSSLKHAFTALQNNLCSLGCAANPNGTALGSGCSDPYSVSNNSSQSSLGSRAWVNPFTGAYPSTSNSHTGHTHVGTSHRILTEVGDLIPAQNPGATYFAEGQYVTPHEYAWCQSHPGECNMYNNVSSRQYNVTSSASPFTFVAVGSTARQKPAIVSWTGATSVELIPDPGNDGVAIVAYKVLNPTPGVWHYEYAIYNQNLDRAIQSFGLPMGAPVTLSNIGFHAPPQHPGWSGDGTVGNTGFSSTPWASTRNAGDFLWSTETFAQNPNANAVRWGTLYNYRFDANFAPMMRRVTIGFFKTGAPIIVVMQVPTAMVAVSGRVLNGDRGVTGAHVTITDGNGFTAQATSNRNGAYHFDTVPSGGSYTVTVTQRRFTFNPQTIAVNDTVTGADVSAVL